MKITWFGASAFRLYVGGRIVVTDPEAAPPGIEATELTAAADHVIDLAEDLPGLSPFDRDLTPARRRPLDAAETRLLSLAGAGLLVEAPDEGPLIVMPASFAAWDRFADDAVAVLFGEADDVAASATALLRAARPLLVALATADLSDQGFDAIAAAAGRAAVQVLEPGLAIEA